jgi:hypothetical protein
MPTINLTDDELDALVEALRRTIDDDKFPLATRLLPLRAALAKLEAAQNEKPQPATPKRRAPDA